MTARFNTHTLQRTFTCYNVCDDNNNQSVLPACPVWGVEDLIVEDREVESQSESDWVGRCQFRVGDIAGRLVRDQAALGGLLPVVAGGKLGSVPVVVALPGEENKTVLLTINL